MPSDVQANIVGGVYRERNVTRQYLRVRQDTFFAFDENMARCGYEPQSQFRGEPNAIGIPTKWGPGMAPGCFFADRHLDHLMVRTAIDAGFKRLLNALHQGHDVVIPAEGLGTGLAELPTRAPKIHAYIEDWIARLEAEAAG